MFNLERWIAYTVFHEKWRRPRRKPRRGPARDWRYRKFIRLHPCCVCGRWGTEAAHTGPHSIGIKSSDYQCIPLCREHHTMGNFALDKIGPERFQAFHGIDIGYVIEGLTTEYWSRVRAA